MPVAAVCMSHSPLLTLADSNLRHVREVHEALDSVRRFVDDFDPDLVVLFAPDHYSGFFYNLMPPFCLGLSATGVGDFGTGAGPINVPRNVAEDCAHYLLSRDFDLPVSIEMRVDHGSIQPLEFLFGDHKSPRVLPFFVNGAAPPFTPVSRMISLGNAVGEFAESLEQRVLFVGSGGLSHDPPVPRLENAEGEVLRNIVSPPKLTQELLSKRQENVLAAAEAFTAGIGTIQDLNPEFDRDFLKAVEAADFERIAKYDNDSLVLDAGHSAQEIRTWICAFAALAAHGEYEIDSLYYRPIPEFIAGFGVISALPKP